MLWLSVTVPLLKHCQSMANHFQAFVKNLLVSDKLQNTRFFPRYQRVTPVQWPCTAGDRPLNFYVLSVSPQFLITAKPHITMCISRVLRVFTMYVARGCTRKKVLTSYFFYSGRQHSKFFLGPAMILNKGGCEIDLNLNFNSHWLTDVEVEVVSCETRRKCVFIEAYHW